MSDQNLSSGVLLIRSLALIFLTSLVGSAVAATPPDYSGVISDVTNPVNADEIPPFRAVLANQGDDSASLTIYLDDPSDDAVTLAFRDGQFLVAGYAYDLEDSRDDSNDTSVDYNVLTSEITVNGNASKVPGQSIPWKDWSEADLPGEVPALDIKRLLPII